MSSTKRLVQEVQSWERLVLDKSEDRLWHDSDGTWWKRDYDKEKATGRRPCLVRAEMPEALRVTPPYVYLLVAGSATPEIIAGAYYDHYKALGTAMAFLHDDDDANWKWNPVDQIWELEDGRWLRIEVQPVTDWP